MSLGPTPTILLRCSILAGGCGDSGGAPCSDDQCASHFCKADGTCGQAPVDAPAQTRTSGFTRLLTKRSFAWVAECFGSVATVQGQDFGSGSEFGDDAEVWRLTP